MQVLPSGSQIYKVDLLFAVWTADTCMPEILSNMDFIFKKKSNKVEIELSSDTDTQKGYLCCQNLRSISFMQVQCPFNWKINNSSCFYLFKCTLQTFFIQQHKNVHPVFYHFNKINEKSFIVIHCTLLSGLHQHNISLDICLLVTRNDAVCFINIVLWFCPLLKLRNLN